MTRTVEDSLLMMDVVAQPDHRDWYSDRQFDGYWIDILDRPLEGLKVAYSPTLGYVNVDPGVRACVDRAVATLVELGAEVEEIDPGFSDPLEMFSTLWFAGAGKVVSGMSEAQRDFLDPGFRAIGEQGMKIDIVDYMKAVDARAALGIKMGEFHQQYDLLVTPTLPITAFDAGRDTTDDSQKYWMEWTPFSYPFNLTQQPASTSPCGLVDGLPVGLQIVGAKGADALVLNACRRLERALPMQWLSRPKAGSRG